MMAGVRKYKSIPLKLFNFFCKDEIDQNNSNKSYLDKNQFYIDSSDQRVLYVGMISGDYGPLSTMFCKL